MGDDLIHLGEFLDGLQALSEKHDVWIEPNGSTYLTVGNHEWVAVLERQFPDGKTVYVVAETG